MICLKNFFKSCDIFGINLNFKIHNFNKFSSVYGGIFSIIFLILFILYIIFHIYHYLSENEFYLYSSTEYISNPYIDLNKYNYNFAFTLQFINNNSIANSLFSNYFQYEIHSKIIENNIITNEIINTKICGEEDFEKFEIPDELNNNINSYTCPHIINEDDFILNEKNNYLKYIQINIKLNENVFENLEEFKQLLLSNPIQIKIFYIDSYINNKNKNNPIHSYLNSLTSYINFNNLYYNEIYLSNLEYNNDRSLLFVNKKTKENIISLKTHSNILNTIHNQSNLIVNSFAFLPNNNKIIYYRIYLKLNEIISNFLCLFIIIYNILKLVINFFEIYGYEKKLIINSFKYRGNKNYDLNYMITAFGRDEINLKITDLLNKNYIDLYKEEKIYSENENVMKLIESINNANNNNLDNSIEQSFISNEIENSELDYEENKKNNDEILNNLRINHFDSNRGLKEEKKNTNKNIYIKKYKNHSSKNLEQIMENSSEITNSIKEIPIVEDKQNEIINDNFSEKNKKKKKGILKSPNKKKSKSQNKKKTTLIIDDNFHKNELKKTSEYLYDKMSEMTIDDTSNNKIKKKFIYRISTAQIIKSIYCTCFSHKLKKKKKFYDLCKEKLNNYLDINNYIKSVQDINLLKYIIFDFDQLLLFNYLERKAVKLNDKKENKIYDRYKNKIENKWVYNRNESDEVYTTFKRICKKKQINFEDLKLIRLLNAEVDYLS